MDENGKRHYQHHRPESAASAFEAAGVRRFTSDEILADAREVLIEHGASLYRLRATRNGKLILTK